MNMFSKPTATEPNTIAHVYAIKDELTGKFMQPFFLKGKTHRQEAERLFKSQGNNIALWKENPKDFGLYWIGMFDEELGFIYTRDEKIPELVNHLSAYIN